MNHTIEAAFTLPGYGAHGRMVFRSTRRAVAIETA